MQLGVDSRTQVPLIARVRPWITLLVAAIVFALIPIIGLPLLFALPLIGLALALGAPPDHVADARAVARVPRNLVIGILILICVAVMVLQPQLAGWWRWLDCEMSILSAPSQLWPHWLCHWRWLTLLHQSETSHSADRC